MTTEASRQERAGGRRRLMARAGAALFAGEALLTLLANAIGGTGHRQTLIVGAVSLGGLALAAIVFFGHERLNRAQSHAIAATGGLFIGVVVAAERPIYGLLYVWLVFFVASFFRPRAVAAHVAWILACDAVAVWISDPVGRPAESWILLGGTLAGAATLVCVVRGYLTGLAERERQSRAVLDTVYARAPIGLALFDRELRYVRVNDLFASWSGRSPEEHVGLRADEVQPGVGAQVDPSMRRIFATGEPELGIIARLDDRVFLSSRYPITDAKGRVTMVASVIDDITDLTAANERIAQSLASERETNAFLDTLLEHAPLDLAFLDTDLVFRRVNRRVVESSGRSADAIVGHSYEEVYPELAARSVPAIRRVLETGEPVIGEELRTESPAAPGEYRHWLINRFQVRDAAGAVLGVTSTRVDVSALKQAEESLGELLASEQALRAEADRMRERLDEQNRLLAQQARTDTLTAIANRPAFSEQLSSALARAHRENTSVAVLYLDLDGFKEVNDRHGHQTGDRLLEAVAARLRSVARATDLVARIGGDEFVILLSDLAPNGAAAIADEVANRVHDIVGRPVQIGEIPIRVSASIGIALHPTHATDADGLVAAADAAMYASKRTGRARTTSAGEPVTASHAKGRGHLRPAG